MMREEAIEILEEVKTLDDSMYVYNSDYCKALDMAIDALKAQQPRVMTLDEVRAAKVVWLEQCITCVCAIKIQNFDSGTMSFAYEYNNYTSFINIKPEYYGKVSRCWTARPDEKRMAETPWDGTKTG